LPSVAMHLPRGAHPGRPKPLRGPIRPEGQIRSTRQPSHRSARLLQPARKRAAKFIHRQPKLAVPGDPKAVRHRGADPRVGRWPPEGDSATRGPKSCEPSRDEFVDGCLFHEVKLWSGKPNLHVTPRHDRAPGASEEAMSHRASSACAIPAFAAQAGTRSCRDAEPPTVKPPVAPKRRGSSEHRSALARFHGFQPPPVAEGRLSTALPPTSHLQGFPPSTSP
jgi:hypothetical protein